MTPKKEGLEFIGSAKISENLRVTLIEEVAAHLKAEPGGKVLYYLDSEGKIVIEASKRVL